MSDSATPYTHRDLQSAIFLNSLAADKQLSPRRGEHMEHTGSNSLDGADFRILRALIDDGRATDVNLGERVHLSSTAAARCRRILEETGAILGYSARLDANVLGHGTAVILSLELSTQEERALNEFEANAIHPIPVVQPFQYRLKGAVRSCDCARMD